MHLGRPTPFGYAKEIAPAAPSGALPARLRLGDREIVPPPRTSARGAPSSRASCRRTRLIWSPSSTCRTAAACMSAPRCAGGARCRRAGIGVETFADKTSWCRRSLGRGQSIRLSTWKATLLRTTAHSFFCRQRAAPLKGTFACGPTTTGTARDLGVAKLQALHRRSLAAAARADPARAPRPGADRDSSPPADLERPAAEAASSRSESAAISARSAGFAQAGSRTPEEAQPNAVAERRGRERALHRIPHRQDAGEEVHAGGAARGPELEAGAHREQGEGPERLLDQAQVEAADAVQGAAAAGAVEIHPPRGRGSAEAGRARTGACGARPSRRGG